MSLRWRIAVPFAVLLTALFVAVTFVAADQVSRAVERRLTVQAEKVASLRPLKNLEASPELLAYLKEAYGAEILVEREGSSTPLATTVEGFTLNDSFRREAGSLQLLGPYLAAWAPINEKQGLVFLYDPEIVNDEKSRAVGPVITVGVVGFIAVIILAFVITFTIVRPMERLAAAAREVSGGNLDVEIPPVRGGSEIDGLVKAFGDMLDGLRRSRQSERLAVLGQMAAGIAHEIRNPLSAMKMTTQMLREEAKESAREPYDVLLREIDRLDLAVSELFNAANPTKLQKEPVGLSALADEVLTLLRPQLTHVSVDVEKKFDSESKVTVDRNVFKRALMNLILNGAQSMPKGGPLVVGTSGENGQVRFFVRDGGGGIPEETRARVFEPFYTTKEGGVGLGLAVTKRIVEDHGGTVGFDTSKEGSTFWVELPGM